MSSLLSFDFRQMYPALLPDLSSYFKNPILSSSPEADEVVNAHLSQMHI